MENTCLGKKVLVGLLASVVLIVATFLLPTSAYAEEALPIRMQAGPVAPEANDSMSGTLMWAGKQWYVIGANGAGVAPSAQSGAYTLLAKNSFGDMAYREGQASDASGLRFDTDSGWYYSSTWINTPADYLNSTVQQYLEDWLQSSGATPLEQSLVVSRVLADVDSAGTNAQPLWLLSGTEELAALNQVFVALDRDSMAAAIDKSWWTRTASADDTNGTTKAVLVDPYGSTDSADYIHNEHAVRPASTVDLSSVEYTSVAEARRGKTLAEVGSAPTAVTTLPAPGKLPVYKYTIRTSDLELSIKQKEGQPNTLSESIAFSYKDATAGDAHYVSCVLTTKTGGEVAYYGKLGEVDESGVGEVTLSAARLADGTYELRLYNEQSTGTLTKLLVDGAEADYEGYTDFVSAPTYFSLYVQGGKATTATEGTISYELNGGALPEGKTNPTTHKLGDAAQELASPARDDAEFVGWFRTADFDGEPATAVDDSMLGDVTLYAKWKEADDAVITYAATGKGSVSPKTESVKPSTGKATGSTAKADAGYHFVSWTDAKGDIVSELPKFVPQKVDDPNVEATYTANFEANAYQVAFDANGGTGEMQPQAMAYDTQAALHENEFAREGHTFIGWAADASAATKDYADKADVLNLAVEQGSTVTLFALWKAKSCVVEFVTDDEDGATMGAADGVIDKVDVDYGHKVERPADPQRAGYDFKYWAAPDGSEYDFDTLVVGDIVLRAVWQARDYEVAYDAAGGLLPGNASRTVTWRTADLLPESEPTYERHVFDGWHLDETKVDAAATYASLAGNDSVSSITLVAHWLDAPKPTYSVTFDSAGGTPVASQTVTEGASAARPADPTREGYVFDDWYVTGTEDVFSFDTALYDNVSLTAHWIEAGKYQVTYAATGDVPVGWTPVTYGLMRAGDVFMVDDPAATGYEFDGWYVGANRSVKYNNNAFFTMPASDVTLTGTWKKASAHTVTFDSRGGSTVKPQQVEDGSFATRPGSPTRDGFIFKGWQLDGQDYGFDEPVIADVLLTAIWEREVAKTATVSFDLAGGKGALPAAQTVAIGSKVTYPEGTFERDGYEFYDWVTSSGLAYDFDAAVKNDLTLYAGWTAKLYQVSYDTGSGTIPPATVTWDTAALNAPLPTRDGWVFAGWYCGGHQVESTDTYAHMTRVDSNGAWNPANEPDPDTASITLKAKWTAKTDYSVTYDAAGGIAVPGRTGLTLDSTAHADDKSGFADVATTRDGYRFMGWNCETKQGDDKLVTQDDTYETLASANRANITLVAQWKETTTLTFTADVFGGGTMKKENGTIQVTWTPAGASEPTTQEGLNITAVIDADTEGDITVTSTVTEIGKENYFLVAYWFYPDGTFITTEYELYEQTIVVPRQNGRYAPGTYTASFVDAEPLATVEYAAEGIAPAEWAIPKETLPYYVAGDTVTLPLVLEPAGWTFKGWKLTSKSSDLMSLQPSNAATPYDEAATLYKPGDTYTVTDEDASSWNTLVFAGVWEKAADAKVDVAYAVTGDAPKDWTTPEPTANREPGSSFELAAVGTYEGYTFDGWYLGDIRYEPAAEVVLPLEGNATFTGSWKKGTEPVDPDDPDDPGNPSDPDNPSDPGSSSNAGPSTSGAQPSSLAATGDAANMALAALVVALVVAALVAARAASKHKE